MAFLLAVLSVVGLGIAATFAGRAQPEQEPIEELPIGVGNESIVVGGGCFWCLEPLFEMIRGVTHVEVGYAGGARPNPTYEQVCTGTTGHAEVVKITFDPKQVKAEDLLRIFFTIHDPTTKDRQGPDFGPQYRSVVFYATPEEKQRAEKVIDEIRRAKIWKDPLVTTLEPLRNYTRAEAYHQDYYAKFETASVPEKLKMNAGYCTAIIEPKVLKFKKQFQHLMKGAKG